MSNSRVTTLPLSRLARWKTHNLFGAQTASQSQLSPALDVPTPALSPDRPSHISPAVADNPFEEIPQQSLAQYSQWIFKHSRSHENFEALNLFERMFRSGIAPDGSTLSCVLKVSSALNDRTVGKQLHCHCVKSGFTVVDVSVGTSLIDMYMKTGSVEDGEKIFSEMGMKNVVSWTSLLVGYSSNGFFSKTVEMFSQMLVKGIAPNQFTFTTVLGALADSGMLKNGSQVHTSVVKFGHATNVCVGNSLISMYSKFGTMREAKVVFNCLENKDVVTWNCMISGLVVNGLDVEALQRFHEMRISDVQLTHLIFAPVIKVSANLKELSFAEQLHCHVTKSGLESNQNTRIALLRAYSKSSKADEAFRVFSSMTGSQNVVSWTAMISAHLQNGGKDKAMLLFLEMIRAGIRPNDFTFSTILTAHPFVCPFQVHAQVFKTNYKDSPSAGTALFDAYAKTGKNSEAARVFASIVDKDVVAWSAMLYGYAQVGDVEGVVNMFSEMAKEGMQPNEFTFSITLNMCAGPMISAEQGKQFHASALKFGLSNALCVSSALVTMYAKRGNIQSAHGVFKRQGHRDLISWNSMITGFAQHGYAKMAVQVFEEMRRNRMEVDGITFIGVIIACTHSGLVAEGQMFFDLMVNEYRFKPTMDHYACMVDLYGRVGMLEKAMDLIKSMPFQADATVWRTFLGACRNHRNEVMGEIAGDHLISLQPQDPAAYVLLSNIYASNGNWKKRAMIRNLMNDRKVKKLAGYSWIQVKNKTHSFLAGDRSHPLSDQIYLKLEDLTTRLKNAGYVPDQNYVLQDVEDELKEAILAQHSERLAIAFGLIATPPRTPLQIEKNLRVCGDCHTVIKLISMIEERSVTVRDTVRFHHFKGGLCSCGDFW